jgi:hypothetical protein
MQLLGGARHDAKTGDCFEKPKIRRLHWPSPKVIAFIFNSHFQSWARRAIL